MGQGAAVRRAAGCGVILAYCLLLVAVALETGMIIKLVRELERCK